MRTILFSSAATFALLGSTAALAAPPPVAVGCETQPVEATFEFAALKGEPDSTVHYRIYNGDYWRASDLLGAAVFKGEEREGRVADIVLNDRGAIDSVIVNVGSFLELGGDEAAIEPISMSFTRTDTGVRVYTPMSRAQLDDAAAEEAGFRVDARPSTDASIKGWSLASLLDSPVDTENRENSAAIDDIIFSNDGHAKYAILRTGGLSGLNGRIGFGGKLTTVKFSDLSLSVVKGELDVDVSKTTAEVADRPAVDFWSIN